jgi:hypothetical protein
VAHPNILLRAQAANLHQINRIPLVGPIVLQSPKQSL